jgi:tripartite-type tricarboxylate transporter receptor subunit TctC
MTFRSTRRTVLMSGAAGAASLALPALAQTAAWPAKPVTIVVPFPPGGGTDAFARPLFAVMTKNTGKQFLIDNRGGAGGTLGAGLAAKAAPDGHTFFMGAVHHTIAPSVYRSSTTRSTSTSYRWGWCRRCRR